MAKQMDNEAIIEVENILQRLMEERTEDIKTYLKDPSWTFLFFESLVKKQHIVYKILVCLKKHGMFTGGDMTDSERQLLGAIKTIMSKYEKTLKTYIKKELDGNINYLSITRISKMVKTSNKIVGKMFNGLYRPKPMCYKNSEYYNKDELIKWLMEKAKKLYLLETKEHKMVENQKKEKKEAIQRLKAKGFWNK